MSALPDAHLWAHVRRSVTPLGLPCPGTRRLIPYEARPLDVDLHGDTVHAAHARVRRAVAEARSEGRREMVVVTGLSGRIRVEFPSWAALDPNVRAMEPLRGGGAFRLSLRPVR